jgi:mycothiol synthase
VSPAYRGRKLGKLATLLAMDAACKAGAKSMFLSTDDNRLPAIRTYLGLGFHPCLGSWDFTHLSRWKRATEQSVPRLSFCTNPSHYSLWARVPVEGPVEELH